MWTVKSNRRRFLQIAGGWTAGIALAACTPATEPATTAEGEQAPDAAATQLVFSMWGDLFSVENMRQVLDSYEADNPGISIEIEHYPFGDYNQKIPLELAAGTGPDVISTVDLIAPQLISANRALDLTPYIDLYQSEVGKDISEIYFPAALDIFSRDDKLFAIPYYVDPSIMWINKGLFDEAGLAYPSAEWTWDEFLNLARQLTLDENGNNATSSDFNPDAISQWGISTHVAYWDSWLKANGTSPWNEDETASNLLDPRSVEALTLIGQLSWERLALSSGMERMVGAEANYFAFGTGRVAMSFNASWIMSYLGEVEQPMVQVIPLGPNGNQHGSRLHSGGYTINAATEHPDEAFAFATFFSGSEERLGKSIEVSEANWGGIPANLELFDSELFQNSGKGPELNNVFREALQTASVFSKSTAANELETTINQIMEEPWNAREPVDIMPFIQEADQRVNELLAEASAE
ncbi:MAG TPA: sugar ABC transporter substrate-binding protein [Caldilineaceae bacterium]|nr:sugar ABC transporter substrate-binding protein [Caldilineaceae bacterium]